MFAYQHSVPQMHLSIHPTLHRQPSRRELLRAELAQAEQEAAFSRRRRYKEILEERLRALARRQVEEEELQARINRARVLQLREEARRVALQREIEAQKRMALAQGLREERRRVYQSEQRELLRLLFGAEDENAEPSRKVSCIRSPATASVKHGKATRRTPVKPITEAKEHLQPHTIVIDFADLFGLPTGQSQSTTPKPTTSTNSNESPATQSDPHAAPHKATAQTIGRSPSVKSRPDLDDIQKKSESSQPQEPTKDISNSLAEVASLASAFDQLESELVFPDNLDFTPSSSRASSRSSSASDAEDNSSISKLAYTSNNTPLRIFENASTKLLNLLDTVESFGDIEIRKARKSVVERIESRLEEVEREVNRRWREQNGGENLTEPSSEPSQQTKSEQDSGSEALSFVEQSSATIDTTQVFTENLQEPLGTESERLSSLLDTFEPTIEPSVVEAASGESPEPLVEALIATDPKEADPHVLPDEVALLQDVDETNVPVSLSMSHSVDQVDSEDELEASVILDKDVIEKDAESDWSEVDA